MHKKKILKIIIKNKQYNIKDFNKAHIKLFEMIDPVNYFVDIEELTYITNYFNYIVDWYIGDKRKPRKKVYIDKFPFKEFKLEENNKFERKVKNEATGKYKRQKFRIKDEFIPKHLPKGKIGIPYKMNILPVFLIIFFLSPASNVCIILEIKKELNFHLFVKNV